MNEETSLIAFKAICNFINDLNSEYGRKHKPLKLYQRLINKTQISHDKAIKKHIMACNAFCVANREAIMEQDASKFTESKISYSQRVYVDMSEIFKIADVETTPVIWQHILTISAIVDPSGKAKEVLRKNVEDGKSGAKEADFLSNIISKVEQNVKPDSNPMEAVSSIMSSGIFNDLLGGMQGGQASGNLDIGKLLGAVQGMVSSLQDQVGDDPEAKQAMGMLNGMSSMVGNIQGGNGAPPDMSQMMGMMSGLMGMAGPAGPIPSGTVEDVSESKEEQRENTD